MVMLKAPEGCTSYTDQHGSHDVPPDGIVDVPADEAAGLQLHGFLPPTAAVLHEDAKLTRHEVNEMLTHLGFAVADSVLPMDKMVQMLKAAVKSKAEAVAKAQEDLKVGAEKAATDVAGQKTKKQQNNS
jgi:hypothetical protein